MASNLDITSPVMGDTTMVGFTEVALRRPRLAGRPLLATCRAGPGANADAAPANARMPTAVDLKPMVAEEERPEGGAVSIARESGGRSLNEKSGVRYSCWVWATASLFP